MQFTSRDSQRQLPSAIAPHFTMHHFALTFVVLLVKLSVHLSNARGDPQQEYIMEYHSPDVQAGMLVPSGVLQPAKTYTGLQKYVLSSDFYPENDRDAYLESGEKRSSVRDYPVSDELYAEDEHDVEPLRRVLSSTKDGKSKVVLELRKDSPKKVVEAIVRQRYPREDVPYDSHRNIVLLSKTDRSFMKPVMAQVIYVVDNKAVDDGGDRVESFAASITEDSDVPRNVRNRRPSVEKDLDWYLSRQQHAKEYSKTEEYPDTNTRRAEDPSSLAPKRLPKKESRKSKPKVSDPPASTT